MVANLNTAVVYRGILTLENVGSAVNYRGIFNNIGQFSSGRIGKKATKNFWISSPVLRYLLFFRLLRYLILFAYLFAFETSENYRACSPIKL
jgi:hypothetical protein